MLAYPITLEDDDGTVLATSPDFPELTTFGDDREEAIARAVHALEEAIAARIHDRKDIPTPSRGETYAVLPTLTSVKVMLYQGMRDQGVGKAELARRLGWHMPQVDRVLDVQHRSRIDQMDAALGAIGQRLHVTAADTADPAVAVVGEETRPGGPVRQGVQRPAGRGPVRVRPAAGAQGLRQVQRLLRGPGVRGRGRERPRRRQTPVQGDDRGGQQAQGPLRGHSGLEIQSRFTRKREHAVAFKSMLRRKGVRVVSITEHADDSPTGKLMEAIIESVDEFYSENLAQEVVRGMREAASRGFFLGSKAPFGYTRVKVSDGVKERPTLEVDPATAPVVKEIFESSLQWQRPQGDMQGALNDRGITNRGKRWYKGGLHYLLTNEAYTGTAVWGKNQQGREGPGPGEGGGSVARPGVEGAVRRRAAGDAGPRSKGAEAR